MNIEDHEACPADLGWIRVSGVAVKEVSKGFCRGLCAHFDLGGESIWCMHGGVICSPCQLQELASDLLKSLRLGWCRWS